MRGDDAEHRIGHVGQIVVGREVAGGDEADTGLVHAALEKLLHQRARLVVRHEGEQRVRAEIARALQERREVGVIERHAQRGEDLRAALGGDVLERGLRFPGPAQAKSATWVTIFLAPFFTAQSAITAEDWPSVKLVRTM